MAAARETTFPKLRHIALSFAQLPGAEALLVPAAGTAASAGGGQTSQTAAGGEAGTGDGRAAEGAAAGTAGTPEARGPQTAAGGNSPPAPTALPRVATLDVSLPGSPSEECRSIDGAAAAVRCVNSLEGRKSAGDAAAAATQAGDAVLLAGLDRWYRLGPEGAGFCRSCELGLVEELRESYGDHVQPFDALAGMREPGVPARERPFARQREAGRFSETIEAGKRVVLRARDEARRTRGTEMAVLGRVGTLSPAALALCRHLDGLVFELPSLDPYEALLPLFAARAALGQRPAVALPPPGATEAQVRLFAGLAAASDADLLLPAGASAAAEAALAAHRRFLALVRERYRPSEPLLDAEVLLSPLCDHWTAGAHWKAAGNAVAALSRLHLQPGVRLELAAAPRTQLLVLAGCSALGAREATAARRHVEGGGDVLQVGRCAAIDDEGRQGDAVFPEVKSGLERVGEGRVLAIDEDADLAALQRTARELLGRGRAHLSLSGRAQIVARAYLDPERKLDVHLVNCDLRDGTLVPGQGVQLFIAGQAAGGGRAGYWFSPEREGGRDGERIVLNPSGFSVSTVLPAIGAHALLAVPR